MTDSDGGYSGPPAMGEPVDPNTGAWGPPGNWGPPGYGPPGYGPPAPYGYPPPGYYGAMPYGPPPVFGPQRPGQVTAASVLGFIDAGFLILAGLLLFAGASIASDIDNADGGTAHHYAAELSFDGFLNLLAAALLIGGGIMLTNRSINGRWLYTAGAVIVFAEAVYWLVRFAVVIGVSGFVFWTIVFAALAVVGASLAWTGTVTSWLSGTGNRPGF